LSVLPARRETSTPARVGRQARVWTAAASNLLPVRRKASAPARLQRRARELLPAAPQLDVAWARSRPAIATREATMRFVLKPLLTFYTRRRTTGRDKLGRVRAPVILVANHVSHIDTPVILAALPRRFRKRTVVGAAADYFYRNRLVAMSVSLFFNTIPMDRRGGGLKKQAADHVDRLLDRGWNLLLFPEGTRSRNGGTGRLRRGAAVLAARHNLMIVPIRITGTRAAMPPGRFWPSRMRSRNGSKRHAVSIAFGDPITPTDDPSAVIKAVQSFFEREELAGAVPAQRRLGRASSQDS
jgi:1-acyl-sn-glycerol-3-phosphate acyltransferase